MRCGFGLGILGVVAEPILSHEEALYAVWLIADILKEVREIKELLKDGEEEEED